MMKSEINLLPQKIQKRRVYQSLIFGVGKFLRSLYFSVLLLVAALILIYGAVLSIQEIVLDEDSVGGELADINIQARDINLLLQEFEETVGSYIDWSDLIEDVIQATSEGMNITSIAVRAGSVEMKIEGTADNRQVVQEFQAKLERMEWVNSLDAPLQNFATGETAQFSFVVEIKNLQLGGA